jgi:hypothetical protein
MLRMLGDENGFACLVADLDSNVEKVGFTLDHVGLSLTGFAASKP